MKRRKIRIGSRGSILAKLLAEEVKLEIVAKLNYKAEDVEIVTFKTSGDILANIDLFELGGKGLFIKEIEEALLREEIDIAVHALKDVPDKIPEGLKIAAVLKREDPRDIFLSNNETKFGELPENSIIGTCSPRRKIQLLQLRPDFQFVTFRGNIDTRIKKLVKGEVDGTMLALAGINRARISNINYQIIDPKIMIPAIGQGAIAIEIRLKDESMLEVANSINHIKSFFEISLERIFLQTLEANCRKPVAAYARTNDEEKISFDYLVASADYKNIYKDNLIFRKEDSESEIEKLGFALKKSLYSFDSL